jgi:hypothetical protein
MISTPRSSKSSFDSVKDHLIPHIERKTTGKDMFDALVTPYQSENINWKMLRNKFKAAQMSKIETIAAYLMKTTKLHDQLEELVVPIALNGFSSSWRTFICGDYSCKMLPTFERLWDDFIQEETRLETVACMEEEKNLDRISNKKSNKKGGPWKGQKRTTGFKFL